MDLVLSRADLAFQAEVQAFLQVHLTEELRAAEARNTGTFCHVDAVARWHNILYTKGWIAPGWPAEHGGPGWSVVQRYIFAKECALAGTPRTFTFGIAMCGPVIMRYGTIAQKEHYLPRILSGEDRWCQGYSEPGSGSDLASLQTRAVRDGDDYIVNGTKIWTTFAHHANRMFCLVRTDLNAKPQLGISFLLIDLNTPGISIRPIVNIAGDHEFNQVYFDDVRVPRQNCVGPENEGWTVAKYLLEFERGGNYAASIRASLLGVARIAQESGGLDPALRAKIAAAEVDVQALEITELRCMSALSLEQPIGPMSSLLKLKGSELVQRVDELALEALGNYAAPDQSPFNVKDANQGPIGPGAGRATTGRYLYDRAISIYGGTSEVQRNILARAVLGL